MNTEKITKGEWIIDGCYITNGLNYSDLIICDFEPAPVNGEYTAVRDVDYDQSRENAKLICEAGNVANTTGLSPAELLKQRDELLEACKSAQLFFCKYGYDGMSKFMEQAIKNCES